MKNLSRWLVEHATSRPPSVFCTFLEGRADQEITFGDLFERSAGYAAHYRDSGLRAGDLVLIMLRHSPHLFYAFFGAVLAGATPSFMPYPTPKQRPELFWRDHRSLFARIQPSALVTYKENADAAHEYLENLPPMVTIADDTIVSTRSEDRTFPGLYAAEDDVACLQHSSGTTGLKKGVMLSHREIGAQIDAYARSLALEANDRIASWLPLYHDMGFIATFLMPFVRGLHVAMIDPIEWSARPRLLFEAIERFQSTLCWMPNFAFGHLVNTARAADAYDLSSIRAFVNCSEPCRPTAFSRFVERFEKYGVTPDRLQTCYALAENVFAATQSPVGLPVRSLEGVLSSGRPIDGVEVEICRSDGGVASERERGEIVLRSPFLFTGYQHLPDLTARRLQNGRYRTGDIGFIDSGELFVTGRSDDLLIVNGRNVHAHELEDIANGVPGSLPGRVVAFQVPNARNDGFEVVMLLESDGVDGLAAAVKAAVSQHAAIDLAKVEVVPRATLVKTTSGKISRVENQRRYLELMRGPIS